MLAAAAATGRSTYLYWLPCRGSMLSGSIIYGYDYVGPDFSDASLRRMDGDVALVQPWTSELNLVAMALLGGGVAHARCRAAVATEDQGRCGTYRFGHACGGPGWSRGDRRCPTSRCQTC